MWLLALIAIILSIIALNRVGEITRRMDAFENKNKHPLKAHEHSTWSDHNFHTGSHPVQSEAGVLHPETHNDDSRQTMSLAHKEASFKLHKVETEPYKEPAFVTWLKEDWLLKLGGVLVIMGVLFFLSLAFEVIGPAGKIAIGYLFGISMMGFGFWYARKQVIAGLSIHLIGAIVIIITSYVAYQPGFEVFSAYFAMVLMFLTTVCIALTAFMYDRASLAHVGLFIAGLVPVLTHVEGVTFFEILVYLAIVIVGVVWLAFVTRWRSLILMSLLIVSLYSVSYITGGLGSGELLGKEILMIIGFGTLFYITSLFSIIRMEGQVIKDDGVVALLNAGFALLWITSEANPELAPILIATVGLIYAAGFFFVYKITNVYTSFLVYGGVALGMLTTAIMLELSGRALTVVLILMGAGVTFFTYYLSRNDNVTKIIAFFNLLPLLYIFRSVETIGNLSFPTSWIFAAWKDFMILGLAIIVYYMLYRYFVTRVRGLGYVALTLVVLLIIDVVWQALHLMTTESFATELSLLVIGIGLTIFVYNFSEDKGNTEKTSFVNLLAFFGVITSLFRISDSIADPALITDVWKDWASVFLVMSVAFVFYYFFLSRIKTIAYAGLVAGLFLVVTSIWQLLHLIIGGGTATFISILIYTIVGLYTLWSGSKENNDLKIKISRVWLGAVAARVIFVDAWQSGDVAIGVLICIVIGVLLLSSAFIIKKATSNENTI